MNKMEKSNKFKIDDAREGEFVQVHNLSCKPGENIIPSNIKNTYVKVTNTTDVLEPAEQLNRAVREYKANLLNPGFEFYEAFTGRIVRPKMPLVNDTSRQMYENLFDFEFYATVPEWFYKEE
jgi:hypothetical protein